MSDSPGIDGPEPKDVADQLTELLQRAHEGDQAAADEAYRLVMTDLVALAKRRRRQWDGDHTMDTMALVGEAYLKVRAAGISFENRRAFFAVMSRAMKHVLLDYAKWKRRRKRGAGADHVPLDDSIPMNEEQAESYLVLHDALESLAIAHPRCAQAIELNFFVQLTVREIAEVLDLGPATVGRDLRLAKAWLRRALGPGGQDALWETEMGS